MAERAGLFKEYEENFVLDETRLRKIVSIYEEYAKRLNKDAYINLYVGREDSSYYETRSVDEVLSDPNTPGKSIKNLGIELKDKNATEEQKHIAEEDRRPLVIIGFNRLKDMRIRFGVTGQDRDWCFLLTDELDSQVKRLLRGRISRWLPQRSADVVVFTIIFGLSLAALASMVTNAPPAIDPSSIDAMTTDNKIDAMVRLFATKKSAHEIWIIPISLIVVGSMIWLVELRPIGKIMDKVSRSVFYWGDMIPLWDKQQSRLSIIKWVILAGFIISLMATIVGGYLMGQKISLP